MAYEHALVLTSWLPQGDIVYIDARCDPLCRSNPPTLTQFPLLYVQTMLSFAFNRAAKDKLVLAARRQASGMGYMKQQSTRPQTLGYSLSDSPVGLLGWIYEKLVAWTQKYPWTDNEGALLPRFYPSTTSHRSDETDMTMPIVLEWVSIYYFSRAGPVASTRIYYEMSDGGAQAVPSRQGWTSVPLGVSYFPGELQLPRLYVFPFRLRLGWRSHSC